MNIVYKKLTEIMPYEKNPRNNELAIDKVANSIKEFGIKQPLVIDAAGVIVVGHTRYLAAKRLGIEEVPCVLADDLNPYQIKAYRLADNKVSEFSEWNFSMLEDELSELDEVFDMDQFGFEEEKIEIEEDQKQEEDLEAKLNIEDVIVIHCDTESELEKTFNKLIEEGYQCQILTL